MNDEPKNELTPEEQAAFKALPREAAPSVHLEEKVVGALRRQGLLAGGENVLPFRLGWLRLAGASAALLLLGFLAGWWWQTGTVPPADYNQTETLPRFLLILSNPPETFQSEIPSERLRGEYEAWAQGLARRGLFLAGEELGQDGRLLHPNQENVENEAIALVETLAAADRAISGYFVIRAADYDQAVEIAQTCPHLSYGGAIEVRAVVP